MGWACAVSSAGAVKVVGADAVSLESVHGPQMSARAMAAATKSTREVNFQIQELCWVFMAMRSIR